MQFRTLLGLALTLACAQANIDPATSNSKGKKPKTEGCSAEETSTEIQAAECSHNTRTNAQTFAVFKTDHSKDSVHGAPYGTCQAYTCTAPTELEADSDYWTFFWNSDGDSSGVGTGCIRSPSTGECGCENSSGTFIAGSSSCT
ncbi:Small secreted [Lecanosticta acicola]|uniref:Small secreted n=1 Tax=Lecanosticta acicola TaxID=111012 RepID=A0AAI8YZ63_9PEZI|nr:Small secreted [Lecanosticta acicola]